MHYDPEGDADPHSRVVCLIGTPRSRIPLLGGVYEMGLLRDGGLGRICCLLAIQQSSTVTMGGHRL